MKTFISLVAVLVLASPMAMAEKNAAVVEAFPQETSFEESVLEISQPAESCVESPYGDDAWGSDPATALCID